MSDLEDLTARVKAAVGPDSGLGKSLKFDLKGKGFLVIDGASVSNEDGPVDLTITISGDDLKALGAGKLDPMSAIMTGRMKLSDMGLAMGLQAKLQALFSRLST